MKVLHITGAYPVSESDSHGIIIAQLCESITEEGVTTFVLAPRQNARDLQETRNNITIYRYGYMPMQRLEMLPGTSGSFSALQHSFIAWINLPFFLFFEFVYAFRCIRREGIDIIHSHWIIPHGIIGALLSALCSKPHISSIHGSDAYIIQKTGFLKLYVSLIGVYTDLFTANSSFTTDQIIQALSTRKKEKIRTIPMGVNGDRFKKKNTVRKGVNKERFVLYVGRLIPLKGVLTLIAAMKQVTDTMEHITLRIIGDGPEYEKCQQLVQNLQLEKNIHLLGRIPNQDLCQYYHESDLFVLPSVVRAGQAEGLGVVLLEAMAAGVPVIGTKTGGIVDIITDGVNGLLVPPDDPDALAAAIVKILQNPDLAERFREAGRETIEDRFSWTVIAREFCTLYRQYYRRVIHGPA